jgi:hypothetical protein
MTKFEMMYLQSAGKLPADASFENITPPDFKRGGK